MASRRGRAIALCWLLAALPLAAQEVRLEPAAWEDHSAGGAQAGWDADAVTLSLDEDAGGAALWMTRAPLTGDFVASVRFELLDWPGGPGCYAAAQFLATSPPDTPREDAEVVQIGRVVDGGLDQYRGLEFDDSWRRAQSGLGLEASGRLRLERRGERVLCGWEDADGAETLPPYPVSEGTALHLTLSVRNLGEAPRIPKVRVRFSDLRVERVQRRPGRPAGGDPAGGDRDWVIYATSPGWLRIGSRAEFDTPTKLNQEIWGGTSEEPLPKKLLVEGLPDFETALTFLCERLTKVHLDTNAVRTPKQVVRAIYGEEQYYLRLDRGIDPDAVLAIGQTYDFDAERKVLAEHGLTPRWDLGYRWLIHATGHGTVDGPARDDVWLLHGAEPQRDRKNPAVGYFRIGDGWGGTFTYSADVWEGPYRDNFAVAAALRRLGLDRAEVWPADPAAPRLVTTADVPEKPRDHGPEVLGVQPITDPDELREWVVYLTADRWLHLGTRTEFDTKVLARETIWSGLGEEPVTKVELPLATPCVAYEQALELLARELSNVRVARHPNNEPRETIDATFRGREVILHLARGPRTIVAGYGGYDAGAEFRLMLEYGHQPIKRFGQLWLVHATGHGTMNGPVQDDHWMMVAEQPQNGGVRIPDGLGGTFGYSVDQVDGPFTDSVALAAALKRRGLESIGAGGYDVRADEFDVAPKPPPKPPKILSFTPAGGEPGTSFYITVIAEGMRPWYGFRFGPGVMVTDEVSLGRNPDGDGERWLATVTLGQGATLNP